MTVTNTDRKALDDAIQLPALEQLLNAMSRFGNPSLMLMSGGWNCGCEMHVRVCGGSYNIRSEFRMDTPMRATRQCAERILQHLDMQHVPAMTEAAKETTK